MPRNVHDDFSFLPSVDSTEEEIVERQVLWEKGRLQPHSEMVVSEQPPTHQESPAVLAPQILRPSILAPQSAEKVFLAESDVSEAASLPGTPAAPEQDGRALWEAFEKEQTSEAGTPDNAPLEPKQPEAETSQPEPLPPAAEQRRDEKPRRRPAETPPVSLSGGRSTKESITPESSSPLPTEKPRTNKSAFTQAAIKPFTAPKPQPAEEPDTPEVARKKRWRRLAEKAGFQSLGWSMAVHLFLLLVAAFVGIRQVVDKQVDFLPGGSSPQGQAASSELHNQVQLKKNPWMKARPLSRKLTVQTLAANVVLPEMPPMDMMDFSKITNRMSVSSSAMAAGQPLGMGGAGGGFGTGLGRGGRFTFVGQTALGKHVVFVVDVSGSMSAIASGESISRFELLKKELVKSLNQMPMGTSYQILYFSDFAWPHDQVDSRSTEALLKYRWEIDSKNYKTVKIPKFRYINASPFSLRESTEIIQRSENPGGTNWGSGLLMALNGSPKPDVIFFMTDGLRSDEQGWVDVVTAENKKRLPTTAIYTSAMQEPDAAPELDSLARRNNGRFTIVLGDGKVVKGEDYFKGKR